MASTSHCFFVVSVAFLLQFFVTPTLASTKYIEKLCSMPSIDNKPFCVQTLSAYPPAASATSLLPLATAVIRGVVQPQAKKAATFAEGAATKQPALKTQFKTCQDDFVLIGRSLQTGSEELVDDPLTANYDIMLCTDQTNEVKSLLGKNKDMASKTLIGMTMQLEKHLRLALAATEVLGG